MRLYFFVLRSLSAFRRTDPDTPSVHELAADSHQIVGEEQGKRELVASPDGAAERS
jgi:hypothetical protein